ncbi:MAG TPA: murein biosynthesis integral membrane protein MurJ [Candidatus Andersenbacteria bacterium]|nr:murein biosynthesis integral membrane protein MurJ [Candidatus Andersenbacteria bacterium]
MAFDSSRYIPRGSVVLAGTTIASYILGLVRDRMLARTFGASVSLDSYNAAFLIPDFLFNLLVASGIAAAAVPLFAELYRRSSKDAHEYANSLLASAVGVMMLVAVLIGIFAPALSFFVAPGLPEAGRLLVVHMMRILALSSIVFAASNAFGAMLVAQKRFLFYGLSPVAYNIGIIAGAVYLAPQFGIIGVAYGTVLGALFHLFVRLVDAMRSGWVWKWTPRPWGTTAMKRTFSLMVPKMIGHPVEMLTFWVFTGLASFLAEGSISVLNFARNFQSVPVSILGITMSTAIFPVLAEAILVSRAELRSVFRRTAWTILFTSIGAAIVVYGIRYQIVTLFLGGGAFNADAVAQTAFVLGLFCLAIPTESLSHLFARAFYAAQDTRTPVIFSVLSLLVSGGSAYLFIHSYGIAGLPLGFFFGSFVKTAGLWVLFNRKISQR